MAIPEYPKIRVSADIYDNGIQLEVRVNDYGISVNYQDLADLLKDYLASLDPTAVVTAAKDVVNTTVL